MKCFTSVTYAGRPCVPCVIFDSPVPDRLHAQSDVKPGEVPGLLERLAQVPDPRGPRGVRRTLAVVLKLTACPVSAGATSLLAVGERIADAPPHVLEQLAVCPGPLPPRRLVHSEAKVRRLLTRIDGGALDQAVGRWLADRRPRWILLLDAVSDGVIAR
ncbi:transposase family protein [Streptomyces sp. NPDC029554]|uniref:transposase family protein n=1 Tax=Streptomyces sp. NPDC029554 TaxID=3155126 RepID=UPI0033E60A3E